MKYVTAAEAVQHIESGMRVFVQGQAATPQVLLEALAARADQLENVETVHLHLEGDAPFARPECAKAFRPNAFFVGSNLRAAVSEGRADYTPIFLSEIPRLFREGVMPLDAALVHVSPPDAHGFVSLGVSVDATLAAVQMAKVVIAQVNPRMPRTLGDAGVHSSRFAAMVSVDAPLFGHGVIEPDRVQKAIGTQVAALVEDGATLQMGIGAIPDAVLKELRSHRALGIHTEMFSDGVLPLITSGVVTNEKKVLQRGRTVASFVNGSPKLYEFVNDNPSVELRDCGYVNDTSVIRQQPKMTAINSAIEVDFTGQVVADSIGERVFSGVGGQMDFIRGATLSPGGKAIIALPSTTSKGESRIVSALKPGAGVVTSRAHVRYVVTEHGVADLYAHSLRRRVQQLISVAAPQHREALEREAFRRKLA
ncbi:MAG: 4-hydroxybutyrate CoA-transferase [Archangium gephyra]|uniref:4-hydroxybutyrate CoA-transferase n=1 Tax=Archangium gephyra TaxID=48 RepID=A0A2W5T685_9BACT|nr:MAG: 4-hydroxybutyrate CoA-transferase [Archangium gephyra]